MTKDEARRLSRIAHNALDVLHLMSRHGLDELGREDFRELFARDLDDLAFKKAWDRLKRELEEIGVIQLQKDGKHRPLVPKRNARARVEQLIEETQEVLEPEPWRFRDQVSIGGKTYNLKVYGRTIRPLNERELADLRATIEADGITVPIFVDEKGNVVDGKHRLLLAHELGIEEFPVIVLEGYTREQFDARAAKLNACRRHLSKKEQAEQRREREARARAMRAGGMSLRQIAEEEGVNPKTIEKDLGESASVVTPKKVRGKDGRRRATRKGSAKDREKRRTEVAQLVARGLKREEIAEKLDVGLGTVKRDIAALKAKAVSPRRLEEEVAPGCFLIVEEVTDTESLGPESAEDELTPGGFLRTDDRDRTDGEQASKATRETNRPADESPTWQDVDAEADALDACLQAAMEGLDEILDDIRGTPTEDKVEAVREIVRVVCWRIEDRGVL